MAGGLGLLAGAGVGVGLGALVFSSPGGGRGTGGGGGIWFGRRKREIHEPTDIFQNSKKQEKHEKTIL